MKVKKVTAAASQLKEKSKEEPRGEDRKSSNEKEGKSARH